MSLFGFSLGVLHLSMYHFLFAAKDTRAGIGGGAVEAVNAWRARREGGNDNRKPPPIQGRGSRCRDHRDDEEEQPEWKGDQCGMRHALRWGVCVCVCLCVCAFVSTFNYGHPSEKLLYDCGHTPTMDVHDCQRPAIR